MRLLLLPHLFLLLGPLWGLDPHRPLDQYQVQVLGLRDGLPSLIVSGVSQDARGYWWIGTMDGLARFDGNRFQVFNTGNLPALKSASIGRPLRDPGGIVWFSSRRGLGRIDNGQISIWGKAQGLVDESIRSLFIDRRGHLWAGSNTAISHIVDRKVAGVPGYPKEDVQALTVARNGTIWAGTNRGLYAVRNGAAQYYSSADGLPGKVAYSLLEDSRGRLWVGSDQGMAVLENGKLQKVPQLPATFHRDIREDAAGAIWIASDEGLYRFHAGQWQHLGIEHGLPEKRIRSTYEDTEGNVWVATFGGGVAILRDSSFSNYSKVQGLVDDSVWTVFEDSRSRLWAGTNDGVSLRQGDRFTTIHKRDGLSNERIGSFAEDHQGAIWIGTAKGLNRWQNGRITVFGKAHGLPDEGILSLHCDSRGRLWVGTVAGLAVYQQGRFTSYTTLDGLAHNLVRSIAEDPGGTLWLGTGAGVSSLRDGRFQTFTTRHGLQQNPVMAVAPDRSGSVWVSTVAGGLARLRQGKAFAFEPRHGLPAQTPYQLLMDDAGMLWMSHLRGVSRVSLAALDAVADGRQQRASVEEFGPAHGLKASGCNGGSQPAAWAGSGGTIWLATSSGVASIRNPASAGHAPVPAFLEGMSAAGEPVSLAPGLLLPPTSNRVSFEYTAPLLRGQQQLSFEYRLQGQDQEWITAGNRREAFFTNLSPGSYQFQVRARVGDGPWGPIASSAAFQLQPWFYQSRWFYALCALTLAAALFAAYRIRINILRKRYESVLEERERISRELHDSLMQGFIGASLHVQAASRMLQRSPASVAERLERAHALMSESIREARDAVTDLRTPGGSHSLIDSVRKCVREASGASDASIIVEQSGHLHDCSDSTRWAVLRVCREAVSNALQHGKAAEVIVRLRCDSGALVLEVCDNGCGFDHREARGTDEGHWGITGMRERVEQLSGHFNLHSTPGQGTFLTARIPVLPQQS